MDVELGDDLLVRRAARRLAVQAAAFTALLMMLLIAVVTLVIVHQQQATADRTIRATAHSADDVGDPPASAWIVIASGQRAPEVSPGLPVDLAVTLTALRSDPAPDGQPRTIRDNSGHRYRVVTQAQSDGVVQVVLDLRPQEAERERLLSAMALAAVAALLLAAMAGVVLGGRAVRPLSRALGLQRSFVADASHELRTPLTLLSTRVQLLAAELSGVDVTAQVREDASGVVSDVQRLNEVVEDLLIAADPRRADEHERVDLTALIEDIVTSARPHAASVAVALDLAADCEQGGVVLGSGVALRRAVLALVDNAIDHTAPDGAVTLSTRLSRRAVTVTVHNDGESLTTEAFARHLGRFHSGGQRSGRSHYGLGLALTNDVANRHGGQLRLARNVAAGTTFELVLPRSR